MDRAAVRLIFGLGMHRRSQVLIDQHGNMAYMHTVKHRDEMLREGEAEGWQAGGG